MGFFYKFVASSMSVDFLIPQAGKLTPYTALVVFSIGIIVSNFIFNTINMYFPLKGEKVSFVDYLKLGSLKLHMIGVFGGIIWGVGMSLNILASDQAGPAIAYGLGQGATLVAAIWGVFIWKEFKDLHNNVKPDETLFVVDSMTVIAFPTLNGLKYLALITPVFVYLLLKNVSGVNLLEKRAEKKWGKEEEYQIYKNNTPVFFPKIF